MAAAPCSNAHGLYCIIFKMRFDKKTSHGSMAASVNQQQSEFCLFRRFGPGKGTAAVCGCMDFYSRPRGFSIASAGAPDETTGAASCVSEPICN